MQAIVGRIGIGKTHYMTKLLYEQYYKDNCMVVTNYSTTFSTHEIKSPELFIQFLQQLIDFKSSGFQPVDFDSTLINGRVAIGVDEFHLWRTSDDHASNRKVKTMLILMSQARKLDIHIFYTAQSLSKIDKDIRIYTDLTVAFKPIFALRYYKKVWQVTKLGNKTFTREMRYILPFFRVLYYELPPEEPIFNDDYFKFQRTYRSGWLASNIYKMYDSNELIMHDTASTVYPLIDKMRTVNQTPYAKKQRKKFKKTGKIPPVTEEYKVKIRNILKDVNAKNHAKNNKQKTSPAVGGRFFAARLYNAVPLFSLKYPFLTYTKPKTKVQLDDVIKT